MPKPIRTKRNRILQVVESSHNILQEGQMNRKSSQSKKRLKIKPHTWTI